jgi:hypothetical protein
MCWFTIVTELGVVPCLLLPSLYYWGALANILFQCGLLLYVGDTFTMFFYGMSSASFAFVDWPNQPMRVLYDPNRGFLQTVRKFLTWIDVDRQYLWTPSDASLNSDANEASGVPLKLITERKTYTGCRALRMIVLYSPVTYIVIAAALASAGYSEGPALYRRILIGSVLVLLLPPLAWCSDYIMGRAR